MTAEAIDQLDRLRDLLDGVDDVVLTDRPALFARVNTALVAELACLGEV